MKRNPARGKSRPVISDDDDDDDEDVSIGCKENGTEEF